MKKALPSILSLVGICAVMAILLALTNYFTAPVIKKNQEAAANKALYEVMPDGGSFEKLDIGSYTLPKTVTEAAKAENGGYVITLVTSGFDKGLKIMCGVNADGTVSGAVCLESNETLGHEKTYGANFTGKNAAEAEAVDTVSGATKTTTAYKNAIKDALNAVIILKGGSVDIRTPEEILADNLAEALPAGEGQFTQQFPVEVLEGIDAVYKADNGAGYVYVIGEDFYGVPTGGTSDNATVAAAHEVMMNSTPEDVDISEYELPKTVVSAQKTASGKYILVLNTEGFKPDLVIECAIDANGTIIYARCVSSNETNGAEKTYGEQFVGKDSESAPAVDTVAGSTLTSTAYRNAMVDALNAVIILKGGSVDIRTPEEILADNLAEALPAGEGQFTRLFIVEVIEGIDAVYTADNGAGYVYVIGEDFYGVPTGGTSENETVAAAHAILSATVIEEIDLSDYTGLPKTLLSAKKTATGNFILETRGAGYGVIQPFEEYGITGSGEYIKIRVSITPEGKIIDTFTISQAETEGIGDACEKEDFYGQFDGKTEENYRNIDTIAGASEYTVPGYLNAVRDAFAAAKILKGGNEQ